jgi:arylsulfatase A-like enzyme
MSTGSRGWLIIGLTVGLGALAAALLWPIPESERWELGDDPKLAAGKTSYLAALSAETSDERPNVLLIVADDLGRNDLSVYGHSAAHTPNIDALARDGVQFHNAYATAAICAPSRAALLTGRYQNRFGFESQPMLRYVRNLGEYLGFRYLIDTDEMRPFLLDAYPNGEQRLRQGLPVSEISLADALAAAGYATGIIGKWHLGYGPGNHPRAFGFQEQYGFTEAFSLYADEGAPGIVEHRHDLFWEEHIWDMGRQGPSAITRNGGPIAETRYLTDAIVEETKRFVSDARTRGRPFFAYLPFSAPHTPFQARSEDFLAVRGAADHNERVYLAMIRRLDWAVGELVRHLDAQGMLDDTLIVFTSDNGGAAYTGATDNGPLRGGKFTQFEGGLAVPLIVAQRGALAPETVRQPVMLTDLFATIVHRCGLQLPSDRTYDSVDLLDAKGSQPERSLFWRSEFNRAVRSGAWKLIQNRRDGQVLLFDLTEDPGERHDLAQDRPAVVADLLAELDAWEQEMAPALWPRVMNYHYEDALGSYWFAI